MASPDPLRRRLSRRDLSLVALGLAVWIALAVGGTWWVHRVAEMQKSCGGARDPQATQSSGTNSPGHGLRMITGQGSCK